MLSEKSSWIRLVPFGGADTVTGSCYCVEETTVEGKVNCYLVDCGLFIGKNSKKLNTNIAHLANKVDAIFVTHGHVDHVGRIPYIYKLGYRGPIYATRPARELAKIRLLDCAKIQDIEYKQFLKKAGLRNKNIISQIGMEPFYTTEDVINVMDQFKDVERGQTIKVSDSLEVCFYNAGHELGSSSIMLTFSHGEETYRLYFSGDVGQDNVLLKKRVDSFKENVDLVVMESTYANRFHREKDESWKELRETAANALKKGGNVVFPTFAVGRTQEILYLFYKDMVENDDWIADIFRHTPVFVDSCMAVQAMEKFRKFSKEFKASAYALMADENNNPFYFPNLTLVAEAEDSKKVTAMSNNYVVFSAAGMCNAGRVLFHLEKDLPNPNSAVIFTGYQAEGSLGRYIIDGGKQAKIHGETYDVRAKIASINAFSAHVDQDGLLKWLGKIQKGYKLFLGHGEPEPQETLKEKLIESEMLAEDDIELMAYGKSYSLYKGGFDVTSFSVDSQLSAVSEHRSQNNKKKISEVERIHECIMSIMEDVFEPAALRLLNALEREINAELVKCRRKKKRQSKPNRSRCGRK